jgi:ABC-type uncharacterized transport system involved in gliding motility auxiliary subunit
MSNRTLLSVTGLAIGGALLVGVNMLAGGVVTGARLDLTENELFTLSQGTVNVLEKLEEPVKLEFYCSRKEAQKYVESFARRVEEFLREYETVAGGKLELEIRDPLPFSEIEEQAIQAGLKAYAGAPLSPDEQLYFGLVGENLVGDVKTIPFLTPSREAYLEYDLTKLIFDLAHTKKTVVGLLSSLPIEGQMDPFNMRRNAPQPWAIVDQIREFYEVRTLQPSASAIDKEIEVLLIVHPKGVQPSLAYAIDQFVLRGGKAMVFTDPYCQVDEPPSDPNNPLSGMMAPRSSELPSLFDAWGIAMPKDKLATDRKFATPVSWQNRGRFEQVPFTAWPMVREEGIPEGEVATAELKAVSFRYPGFLEVKEGATTTFAPLLTTSTESQEIDVSTIQFSPDPAKLYGEFFPSQKVITLAARIGGKAKTAFPNGKPAAASGTDEEPPSEPPAEHLAESTGDINVVVVADADFLEDSSWVQVQNFLGQRIPIKMADNGDFVINTLDFMRGSTDLVTLRARGVSAYPFTVVEDIRRAAEASYRAEEQRLSDEKQKTERELNDLLSKSGENAEQVLMSAEVQSKVADLRKTLVDTNKRLREVRFNLNNDVESLGTWIKALNIAVMPLVVIVVALLTFFYRLNRRKPA